MFRSPLNAEQSTLFVRWAPSSMAQTNRYHLDKRKEVCATLSVHELTSNFLYTNDSDNSKDCEGLSVLLF